MLVLTRNVGQKIVIKPGEPDEVVITVVEASGGVVRLGFSAAPEVRIANRENITPWRAREARRRTKAERSAS